MFCLNQVNLLFIGKFCHNFSVEQYFDENMAKKKKKAVVAGAPAWWDRSVNQIKLSGAQPSVTQRLVTLTRYHKNFCFPSISLTGQPGVKNLVEDRSRYISAVHYETNQLVREEGRKVEHFFCFSVESAVVNRLTQSKST